MQDRTQQLLVPRTGGTADPRTQRHDLAVRGPRRCRRQSDRQVLPPLPQRGIPQVPQLHSARQKTPDFVPRAAPCRRSPTSVRNSIAYASIWLESATPTAEPISRGCGSHIAKGCARRAGMAVVLSLAAAPIACRARRDALKAGTLAFPETPGAVPRRGERSNGLVRAVVAHRGMSAGPPCRPALRRRRLPWRTPRNPDLVVSSAAAPFRLVTSLVWTQLMMRPGGGHPVPQLAGLHHDVQSRVANPSCNQAVRRACVSLRPSPWLRCPSRGAREVSCPSRSHGEHRHRRTSPRREVPAFPGRAASPGAKRR